MIVRLGTPSIPTECTQVMARRVYPSDGTPSAPKWLLAERTQVMAHRAYSSDGTPSVPKWVYLIEDIHLRLRTHNKRLKQAHHANENPQPSESTVGLLTSEGCLWLYWGGVWQYAILVAESTVGWAHNQLTGHSAHGASFQDIFKEYTGGGEVIFVNFLFQKQNFYLLENTAINYNIRI